MTLFFRDNDMRALFECLLRARSEWWLSQLVETLADPILTELAIGLGFKLNTDMRCEDTSHVCSICLEKVVDQWYDIPQCRHRFHRTCLVQFWLTQVFQSTNFFGDILERLPPSANFTCPNCRSVTTVHFFGGKKEDHAPLV